MDLYNQLLARKLSGGGGGGGDKYAAFKSLVDDTLTEVTPEMVEGCTKFSSYIFADCTQLTSIPIPQSVTSIEYNAFYNCTSLASVTIPGSVTSIGMYAFRNCTSLESVTISEGVIYINSSAFEKIKITTLTIPSTVTSIGQSAFGECASLRSVTFSEGFQKFNSAYMAFNKCTALEEVTFPSSLNIIHGYAFSDCNALTRIIIKATTPPSSSSNIQFLYKADNAVIYVPPESVNTYKTATGWSAYADRIQAIPNN